MCVHMSRYQKRIRFYALKWQKKIKLGSYLIELLEFKVLIFIKTVKLVKYNSLPKVSKSLDL